MTRKRKKPATRKRRDFIPRVRREYEQYLDSLHALRTAKQEKLTASQAASAEGIRLSTLLRHTKCAWKRSGRDLVPKLFDRIPRPLKIFGQPVSARNSREASLISRYDNALKKFYDTGSLSALKPFRGKKIPGFAFITSRAALEKKKAAGLHKFDDFYLDFEPRR